MTQQQRIAKKIEESAELFRNKNDNYADSWKLTGIIFRDVFGAWHRMMDKILRATNLVMKGEPDKVGEAAAETLRDLSVYAQMYADEVENG